MYNNRWICRFLDFPWKSRYISKYVKHRSYPIIFLLGAINESVFSLLTLHQISTFDSCVLPTTCWQAEIGRFLYSRLLDGIERNQWLWSGLGLENFEIILQKKLARLSVLKNFHDCPKAAPRRLKSWDAPSWTQTVSWPRCQYHLVNYWPGWNPRKESPQPVSDSILPTS